MIQFKANISLAIHLNIWNFINKNENLCFSFKFSVLNNTFHYIGRVLPPWQPDPAEARVERVPQAAGGQEGPRRGEVVAVLENSQAPS